MPLQLSFHGCLSSGRSEFPYSRVPQPLSRQACSLHAQQMMLNFSPEPNLLWVLMYCTMYATLNAVAHSNANGLSFKRQSEQWLYWNSPKCFISTFLMEWCRFMGSIFNLTSLVDSDQWVSFGILQSWKGCKEIVSLEYTMALEGTVQTSEHQNPIGVALWIFPQAILLYILKIHV